MGKKTPYVKIGGVVFVVALAAMFVGYAIFGGGSLPQQSTYNTQQACIDAGGQWENGQCDFQSQPQGYVPFNLAHVYMNIMNALDTDATYGADDATLKVFDEGKFDFVGPFVDSDGNAATTGQVDLDDSKIETGECYDFLAYQGDGGTNLYAIMDSFCVPKVDPEKTTWTNNQVVYMYTEGAFTESALDTTDADYDESSDVINLSKENGDVQGCISWDFTYTNSVAGSILKEPVIVFEDSASDPLTDLNDIEHIYLSVKSGGQGINLPSGDLRSEFLGGVPIKVTTDGALGSADGFTGTLQVCLPAAEADVGTGDMLMHFDDMGDYRARDLDNDVRAAAETTTFSIEA